MLDHMGDYVDLLTGQGYRPEASLVWITPPYLCRHCTQRQRTVCRMLTVVVVGVRNVHSTFLVCYLRYLDMQYKLANDHTRHGDREGT